MQMKSRTTAAVVGRWQLPHKAHSHLIQTAFGLADQVVIVIGSAWRSRNPKNPFIFEERREMLLRTLTDEQRQRVRFVGVRDVWDDARWVAQVRQKVESQCEPGEAITLVGFEKDESSYYVRRFPGWGYVDAGSPMDVDATQLRNILFTWSVPAAAIAEIESFVNPGVVSYLSDWVKTPAFVERRAEHLAVLEYRKKYPGPVYQTGDAIVEAAGRFLMIERNGVLGNGLFAWPGGHQEGDEDGAGTAIRELMEETTLPVTKEILMKSLVSQKVFDAIGRSPRGKIETTACHFKLDGYVEATLPVVYGRDDAMPKKLLWLTKEEFAARMHLMFDDHDVIGEHFLGEMEPAVANA